LTDVEQKSKTLVEVWAVPLNSAQNCEELCTISMSISSFDKVVVLSDGRVLEFDTPANFLATQSEFRKIYKLEGGLVARK
jgi:hypothetical protein